MVETGCVKDLLLQLCQKHASRDKLKSGQIKKKCVQLFGYLLKLLPKDQYLNYAGTLWKNSLSNDFTPINALLAEIFAMRYSRRYGRAQKLEELCDKYLNNVTEYTSIHGHEFDSCLEFLLCLANWKSGDKIVLGEPWRIPIISPAVFKDEETRTPVCYGDSDLYKTSFCYTHYPNEIFEHVEAVSLRREEDLQEIFEATPGWDTNGKTLFKMPDNRANLVNYRGFFMFGAVEKANLDDGTEVSLEIPVLWHKPSDAMHQTLTGIRSPDTDVKKELTLEDEGFVDLESQTCTPEQLDPTIIWEEACHARDILPARTWENRIGAPRMDDQRTLLVHAGPQATTNVYLNYLTDLQLMAGFTSRSLTTGGQVLTLSQLFSDVVHLLLGVASDTFIFDSDTRKFHIQSSAYITGSTPETIGRLMEDFLDCGAIYVHLEEFSSGQSMGFSPNAGFVVERFKEGVNDYLQYYRGFILHAAETHGLSLLLFHHKILSVYRQLRYLKELCAGERNVQARIGLRMGLPKGLSLLSFLYDQTMKDWGGDNTYLLLYLFRSACTPYLTFLQNWLFDGQCYDNHGEYDIEMNENFLSEEYGERFWRDGYKLKAKQISIPFLDEIMGKAILTCGKSLNLLKLCYPKHDLFDGRHQERPVLCISLSEDDLLNIQQRSQAYYDSIFSKIDKPKELYVPKKPVELKICVDVTMPKECEKVISTCSTPQDRSPVQLKKITEETPPSVPPIDAVEEEIRAREEEFNRIESELMKELMTEYEQLEEAENKEIELLKWQTKRVEMHTQRIEYLKTETTHFQGSTSTITSSKTQTVFSQVMNKVEDSLANEYVSLKKVESQVEERAKKEETVNVIPKLDAHPENKDFESQQSEDVDLDSDSESLPTVRERITVEVPETENNLMEELEMPEDDQIEEEVRTEVDMESSLNKSVYLSHEPAPYESDFTTFASCPSRDLFSITKSSSQMFSPTSQEDESGEISSDIIPLPILIERSLYPSLLAQINLVNKATLSYFNEDLRMGFYFEALRNIFFFQDGEFGHCLSQLIFEKISDGSHDLYNSLSNPFELLGILESALASSLSLSKETSLGDNLFLINSNSEPALDKGFNVTKYLVLKFKVSWPLNLIITESCLESYNKVFSLLLRVKQVIWSLTDCWYHLKRYDNKYGKLSKVVEFRRIQLFRHEMLHFIRSVHTHLCCQLLQLCWTEFQDTIDTKVKDLDQLKTAHETYLKSALKRCLLAPNHRKVMSYLDNAFDLIQRFHSQVISLSWEQGQLLDKKGFERVNKTRSEFLSYSLKLYKVLKSSLKYHYEQHVNDFIVLYDFNGYHDRTLLIKAKAVS